jgi:hypothetical protein
MSVIEILTIIWFVIPTTIWIIFFGGIIGYIILEIKERNDKNGEKIEGKKTL